jgi:DivIVA domain-containing protein
MTAVAMDRQAIERRDFPIVRRGYEPAAVDAHLRAVAGELEQLARTEAGRAEPSLASTASSQVQSILQAAETAAAEIEQDAARRASEAREEAARDARHTRDEAIAQARTHVAAVAQATAALLERVGSVDGEASGLLERLRAAATRLAGDLSTLDTNMGELYDAASGRAPAAPDAQAAVQPPAPARQNSAAGVGAGANAAASPPHAGAGAADAQQGGPPGSQPPARSSAAGAPATGADVARSHDEPAVPAHSESAPDSGDLDGARLVALNMALNGESRADTDRYLAEHFQLRERGKLIDEVYAAIEG